MRYQNEIIKSAIYACLFFNMIFTAAAARAEKEMQATQQVELGGELRAKPELSAFSPVQLQFLPDPVLQGGIFLPMDLEFGEEVGLLNLTYGDKAKGALLLLERLPEGDLLLRLENPHNFNSEECEEEKEYPPGWAHGEPLGAYCTRSGLMLVGKGILQPGVFPKFDEDEGVRLRSEDGDYSFLAKTNGMEQKIEFHKIYRLLLPAGAYIPLKIENLPDHTAIPPKSKFQYHLAEIGKKPGMPFQSSRVGILSFQSLFDFNTDGTTFFERTVTPGDVITLEGGDDAKGVAIYTEKSEGGSKLEIRSYSPYRRPLRSIRINGGAPISLEPVAPVTIVSQGGDAGYWSPGMAKTKSIPAGKTVMAVQGGSWSVEFFTTLDNGSLDINNAEPKDPTGPNLQGPKDWEAPDPGPTPPPSPLPSPSPNPEAGAEDSQTNPPENPKQDEPGQDAGISSEDPSPTGGWASCSLHRPENEDQHGNVLMTWLSLPLAWIVVRRRMGKKLPLAYF